MVNSLTKIIKLIKTSFVVSDGIPYGNRGCYWITVYFNGYRENLSIIMDIYGLFTINICGQMYILYLYVFPQMSKYVNKGAAQRLKSGLP